MRKVALLICVLAVLVVVSIGCDTPSDISGPPPCVPADVAGDWDVRFKLNCWYDQSQVWTIQQNGCDVAILSDSSDPPSGTAGTAWDDVLTLEWRSQDVCYTFLERISGTVDGDTMTGTYYFHRSVISYPTDCPFEPYSCEVPLTAVRRTQTNRAP